ncbi:MAG: TrkA family potassium uptake protein [Calditrichaeota bacterium]|nr:MAG: TrkA family potassium uptake protein [Calditrichota bacterium]
MHHIAVIGISSFGYYMCKYLTETGAAVLAIDVDEAKVDSVKEIVSKAVVADATSRDVLANFELDEFDNVIVSVGESIDTSILITLFLKELKVPTITVKAFTEDHAKILDKIGATVIVFPEKDTARRVAYTMQSKNLLEYFPVGEDHGFVETTVPPSWSGKTLMELDVRRKLGVQVVLIKEILPENKVIVPTGDYMLKDSDVMVVVGNNRDLEKLESLE